VSRRLLLAAALALPLVAFAGAWAHTHWRAQQGQEWLVPVAGYDPRDLLRGHYVQYRYEWPVAAGASSSAAYADSLCLRGKAPDIASVKPYPGPDDRCAIIVRSTLGNRAEVRGLDTGILYVSQERGISLSKQLADPQLRGFIRVRIRPDGVMRPVYMEFKPR
jgi:hypothetical protein